MPSYYVLDALDQPVPITDVTSWARWHNMNPRRQLARETIAEGLEVSTVFLGLPAMSGAPDVLWETMIVGGPQDGHVARTASKAAAVEAHRRLVALARRYLPANRSSWEAGE